MTTDLHSAAPKQLPKAVVGRSKGWPVIWIVPLLAALFVAGLLFRDIRRAGPALSITFAEGAGLRAGRTSVKYRGLTVGEVRKVSLAQDGESVLVKVRLDRAVANLAKEGAQFWVVRPELGLGTVSGLNTIISGPYIELQPAPGGHGRQKLEFEGLPRAPLSAENYGLKILLTASQRGSISAGAPIYYRGIEVGLTQGPELNDNATGVTIPIVIKKRYAPLVRKGSKFWMAKGVEIDFSLFKGAQINLQSLRSLMGGGISFATPALTEDNGPAPDGVAFQLFEDPRKEWLEWAPGITLEPAGR